MKRLRVLSVASEVYPLVKTGGLADVVGALPPALAREGIATRTLVPGYPAVLAALRGAETVHRFARPARRAGAAARRRAPRASTCSCSMRRTSTPGPAIPTSAPTASDWPDNALRFAALGAVRRRDRPRPACRAITPDIVHAHDWQAGLAPACCTTAARRGRAR